MNRKTIINLFSFSLIAALLSSCGSSNNVVSSLGKRKYTKGFYVNLPATNERVAAISNEVVENTNEINKVSEPEVVPVAKNNNAEIEKIADYIKTNVSTAFRMVQPDKIIERTRQILTQALEESAYLVWDEKYGRIKKSYYTEDDIEEAMNSEMLWEDEYLHGGEIGE